ncbi:hypothetical protein ACOKWN_003885 [Vibrio parahaemolyticus]
MITYTAKFLIAVFFLMALIQAVYPVMPMFETVTQTIQAIG